MTLVHHILYIPLEASRGLSTETCGLGDVFHFDGLGSGPYTEVIIIYILCIIDVI